MDKLVRVIDLPDAYLFRGAFKPGEIVWAHKRSTGTYELITLDRKHTHAALSLTDDGVGMGSGVQRIEYLS